MSEMNKPEYDCKICLMIGLIGAAMVTGLATWVLASMGLAIWLLGLVCLAVAAFLFRLVDSHCATRASAMAASHPGAAAPQASAAETGLEEADAAPAISGADEAEAAKEIAADKKAAEIAEKAAEERAAADATAASEKAAQAAASHDDDVDRDGDGVVEGENEGMQPEALDGPRDGVADDLKKIKGIGPKLESLCNDLGFYHFDQIAGWSADEIAWVDSNLEGFKGRVSRDDWVAQSKILAIGGETEFSKRN